MENIEPTVPGGINPLIGHNVRLARIEAGLKLAEVAIRLAAVGAELPVNTLSKIERGSRNVTVDEIVSLARVLEVPPVQLMIPLSVDSVTLRGGTQVGMRHFKKWFIGEASFDSPEPADFGSAQARGLADPSRTNSAWQRFLDHDLMVRQVIVMSELSQGHSEFAERSLDRDGPSRAHDKSMRFAEWCMRDAVYTLGVLQQLRAALVNDGYATPPLPYNDPNFARAANEELPAGAIPPNAYEAWRPTSREVPVEEIVPTPAAGFPIEPWKPGSD